MEFLCPTDRLRILDARAEGYAVGYAEGYAVGMERELRRRLYEMVEVRYGQCPPEASELIRTAANYQELSAILERLKRAKTLAEFLHR